MAINRAELVNDIGDGRERGLTAWGGLNGYYLKCGGRTVSGHLTNSFRYIEALHIVSDPWESREEWWWRNKGQR